MDTNDVSGEGWMAMQMKMWEQSAQRAQHNHGRLVRDHPPATQLVSQFMMSLTMASLQQSSDLTAMATSQLPPAYPPCVLPTAELEYIAISDMRLETHHRGKQTVLRVLTPANRLTAVMAIVGDEKGTAVLLQLYYQPEESMVPAEEIMKQDDVVILKEPFFKMATDGSYSLRVDHLGDIVRLASDDERVPPQWRKDSLPRGQSSGDIRTRGNEAVQQKKWAKAHHLYTSAIQASKTLEDKQLAYLNRSLTNLRLERPAHALCDAERGCDPSAPSEKSLFREARASYELGHFVKALDKLEALIASFPENQAAKIEMKRVEDRLSEQRTGAYNFGQMYKQARQMPPLIDCATFSAPVEVRPSAGRGNGLFTKTAVPAGHLLLCEKAFAYSYAGKDQPGSMKLMINTSTKKGVLGGQVTVLTQLMQKMYHDPEAQAAYHELHHGDHAVPAVSEVDGHPVIDSFLVAQIQSLNGFGAPRTSRESFLHRTAATDGQQPTAEDKFSTAGIWLLCSRINHSCIGNCRRTFIGDMQIIRATKDLEPGTELQFAYRVPNHLESYAEAQKALSSWGFTCTCELCLSRKKTTSPALFHRKYLTTQLRGVLGPNKRANIPEVQRLLKEMEKTYPEGPPGAIRLELWDPYFALGAALLAEGKSKTVECIKMIVRGLETLGFGISTTGKGKNAQFKVTRWGYVTDWTPRAFLHLYEAWARLAPGAAASAKACVGIAYGIVVGEQETLKDEFPQLI